MEKNDVVKDVVLDRENGTYRYEIEVKNFDEVFPDDFNEHGYQVCGFAVEELKEVYNNDEFPEIVEFLKVLPEEIKDEDRNFLIKSDNLKSFITNHILMKSEDDDGYDEMLDIIKQNEPQKIVEYGLDFDYMDDFVDYIYDELIKTSYLTVNGQQIYIIDYDEEDAIRKMRIETIEKYYQEKY